MYIHTVLSGPAAATNQSDLSSHFPLGAHTTGDTKARTHEEGHVSTRRDGFQRTVRDMWPRASH
ncbi:hypothetical protein WH47_07414 [Habropoda laboriosa]|uniref:Uncharacterized protein n=1 Tax=Habropoda laboriosa TaxID=597456 RepID=A0A0L7R658_9HYME|nr:hypothetical protein WH47_07414 [Habropoda laboriosa]